MPILRYTASIDNTITNAFKEDSTTRATGSNMGLSDILEVFSIYAQKTTGSAELARALIQFPVNKIKTDRQNNKIPSLGSVNFVIKLYNAAHTETTPRSFDLVLVPVSSSWEEGYGLDMSDYTDVTKNKIGSNWIQARASSSADGGSWTSVGGDYLDSQAVTQSFDSGFENINIDITSIVEKWITGSAGGGYENYGLGIRLSNTYEAYFSSSSGANTGSVIHNTEGQQQSFYTKKFFGRGTEFFYARPTIEAQWESQDKDNRGNFQISSSVLPAADNLNKIYYYNYSKGVLSDIAGDPAALPVVQFYYSEDSTPVGDPRGFLKGSDNSTQTSISAIRESKGVYCVQIAATSSIVNTTYPYLVDVWSYNAEQFYTGSAITPLVHSPGPSKSIDAYVVSVKNLKRTYRNNENVRFRIYTRKKDWSPTIYTVAQKTPENLIIEDAIYKIIRIVDDYEVIPYGTGSVKYTSLSYDSSGNYFDLDMNLFEKGYQYGIKLSFYDGFAGNYSEQPYLFKFRVE